MENSNDYYILALKLKNGDDVLGVYVKDMTMAFSDEEAMVLWRPIKISLLNQMTDNGVNTAYVPSLYFPYGGMSVPFPMSMIDQQCIANAFFTRFYKMIVPELVSNEKNRHERIEGHFSEMELKEALSGTTSLLVTPETNVIQ